MNINKFIGQKVRAHRRAQNYLQEDVAGLLKITRTHYVNLEAGRHNWATGDIFLICRAFNCPPSSLFPNIKALKKQEIKKLIRNGKKR